MRARATPRPILDTPNRFTVDTPTIGLTRWRVPLGAYVSEIWSDLAPLHRPAPARKEGEPAPQPEWSDLLAAWDLYGAAVAACWDAPDLDIEATRKPGQSLREFGHAVVEELADAGWTQADLNAVAPVLVQRILGSIVSAPEVAARAGFSAAQPAGTS